MSTPTMWTQSAEQKRLNAAEARKRSKPARRSISPETLAALGVSGMAPVEDHTVPHPADMGRPKDTRAIPPIVEKPIVEASPLEPSGNQLIGFYAPHVFGTTFADVVYVCNMPRVMKGG